MAFQHGTERAKDFVCPAVDELPRFAGSRAGLAVDLHLLSLVGVMQGSYEFYRFLFPIRLCVFFCRFSVSCCLITVLGFKVPRRDVTWTIATSRTRDPGCRVVVLSFLTPPRSHNCNKDVGIIESKLHSTPYNPKP